VACLGVACLVSNNLETFARYLATIQTKLNSNALYCIYSVGFEKIQTIHSVSVQDTIYQNQNIVLVTLQ
tara:strand:+ start:144 stop:350 length:207 start_codon:yes stop_codon:yes gene_type:complete